jgi:hypothetical protein
MKVPSQLLMMSVLSSALAACSSPGTPVAGHNEATAVGAPTQDAAKRASPVVIGRPARVYVFAAFGKKCEPVAAPQITVTVPPAKGDATFQPGQETTIMSSAQGTCIGQRTAGTGVYYTARAGASGTDRFSVEARLASGEIATRTFEVRIAE